MFSAAVLLQSKQHRSEGRHHARDGCRSVSGRFRRCTAFRFLSLLVLCIARGCGTDSAGLISLAHERKRQSMPCLRVNGGGVSINQWLMLSRVGNDSDQQRVEANQNLQEAAERGYCDGIALALEAGAEVNGRGPGLWSALHLAARYGHVKAVER